MKRDPHADRFELREGDFYLVQPIARKFTDVLKFDPGQPRDKEGQWTKGGGVPAVVVDDEPIGLAAEARKAGSFEEFRRDYLVGIKHGLYWHVTDNPQFAIDVAKGPRDMSSMAEGDMTAGALMVTSHLENWDTYYNFDPETEEPRMTRPYAALVDLSDVPRGDYRQISRGFGNEFFVPDSSKAKVLGVVPMKTALALDEQHQAAIPQSDEELRAFYDKVIARKFDSLKWDESQHPRDAKGQFTQAGLSAVSEQILQASGGKLSILDLRPKAIVGDVELETIAVAPGEGGQGVGTKAMEALVEWADSVGARLVLSPSQKGYQPVERGYKTTSPGRLKKFYKRFGFVEPKGRHYEPILSSPTRPVMYRPAKVKKYDPAQPRDPKGTSTGGQFTKTTGRQFTSEEGYQWHEQGPGAAWAKALPYDDARALDGYAGFGYHDVNDLRRGTYKTPIIDHFVRAATPEEMRRVGWDPEKNEWVPSVKVKEGEYKTGYPVDPRDAITPEYIARFGPPFGKRNARDYDPDDPYHRVDDGRIVVNQYYRPVPGGPTMMFSIQKAGPDLERLQEVQRSADKIDDLIANRGLGTKRRYRSAARSVSSRRVSRRSASNGGRGARRKSVYLYISWRSRGTSQKLSSTREMGEYLSTARGKDRGTSGRSRYSRTVLYHASRGNESGVRGSRATVATHVSEYS